MAHNTHKVHITNLDLSRCQDFQSSGLVQSVSIITVTVVMMSQVNLRKSQFITKINTQPAIAT